MISVYEKHLTFQYMKNFVHRLKKQTAKPLLMNGVYLKVKNNNNK